MLIKMSLVVPNRNSFGSQQNTIVIPEVLEISEDLLKTVSSTLRQMMTQSSVLFLTRNRLFFSYLPRFGPRHCSLDNLRFPKVLGTQQISAVSICGKNLIQQIVLSLSK